MPDFVAGRAAGVLAVAVLGLALACATRPPATDSTREAPGGPPGAAALYPGPASVEGPPADSGRGGAEPRAQTALAAVAPPTPAPPPSGHRVGDVAPEFVLRLADGTEVTSASLLDASRPTFLIFIAAW